MLIMDKVTKRYDDKHGIFDIDLKLEKGKVYSVIGPNGSGKTTMMKSMAGMINITGGSISINGENTMLRATKRLIGYAMDDDGSYPDVTLYELLHMANDIKFNGEYAGQVEALLQTFSLWDNKHMLYTKCSLGMKKKISLCLSFLGTPPLILLDEPTNGVDTKSIISLKKEIQQAKDKESIIVVTSHVLDFVGQIADENIFINEGKICCIVDKHNDLEKIYEHIYL